MSNMMTSSLCVSGMNRARENEIIDVAITANMDELRVGVCSDEKMITNIKIKRNAYDVAHNVTLMTSRTT